MDRQEVLQAYIQAILPERERYLYQRTLKKSRSAQILAPGEDPTGNRAFENMLYHMQRGDKVYQALKRGELILEYNQSEFDLLYPLMERELRAGNSIRLDFIRSVQRSRVTLEAAHMACAVVEGLPLKECLEGKKHLFDNAASGRVSRFLSAGDLSRYVPRDRRTGQMVPFVMKTVFSRGIPEEIVEAAFLPGSAAGLVQGEIRRSFPGLSACGSVCLSSGETVSNALSREVRAAVKGMIARLGKRFPRERIRRQISDNPSLKRLQRQADAYDAGQRKIRSALVNAVPQHYRDLYPLARAMRRKFVLHLGPTNSGKTYEAAGRLRGALDGIYLGPLRLLAAEQFETLNLNDVPCSLITGEERILVPGSRVQSSTVEMADLKKHYDVAVIDECQMIADRDRGGAWTAAILGLCADEIHACASPDAEALLTGIILDCGDELSVVRHDRMTPLTVENEGFSFPESVRPGDALIVFSKARVHAVAAELKRIGYRVSLIYGALPPDVRRDQAERFQRGDNDVVVSTDAIAMGMNLPIERVVFLESEKYDGDIVRPLTDAEIKQIAGRAGRYGQYDIGYVNAFGFRGTVARALNKRLPPLTEAVIRFPESLLGIPMPLSGIISQWLAMKDKGCFSKASSERMARLVAMMETPNTDKSLLYRFVCIPFDETEQDLLTRWRAMYHAECAHTHVEVVQELPALMDPEECTVPMLDTLEANYRRCDLYYNYARLFLDNPDRVLEEIQRRKDLISQGIIHILSTQKLQQRVCPSCKRRLAWNWPYRVCDACHRRRYASRRLSEQETDFEWLD